MKFVCYNLPMENMEFNKRKWEKPIDIGDVKPKNIETEPLKVTTINENQAELYESIRVDQNSIEDKKDKIRLPMKLLDAVLEKEKVDEQIKAKEKEMKELEKSGDMRELYVARQEYSILNEQSKKAHEYINKLILSDESYMKAYKEYGKNKTERDMISNPTNPRWN